MARFDPLGAIRRWFTLPKRYNSLSDIARDPLGAIANAAQWALPLAAGLPGGFSSLPKLLSNPSLLSKWSLGNVWRLGNLGLGKLDWKDIGLGVGGLMLLQGQQRADEAARALSEQGDIYRQMFELNRPLYEQMLALRGQALRALPSQVDYEAQARRALEDALRVMEQSEQQQGLKTLSAERRRAEALNRYAAAIAGYPLQRLQLLFGLPASQSLLPLQLQTNLLAQQYTDTQAMLQQLGQAVAFLLGYNATSGGRG